jgi:hypothetical protein
MSELNKIVRALRAIENIAMPQSGVGSKTISMQGIYDYQNDMRAAKPLLAKIRMALVYKDPIAEADVLALEEIARRSQEETK